MSRQSYPEFDIFKDVSRLEIKAVRNYIYITILQLLTLALVKLEHNSGENMDGCTSGARAK
jgi:hypothetical protein